MREMLARGKAVGNGSNGGPYPLISLVQRRGGVVLAFNVQHRLEAVFGLLSSLSER
jgi:hypothetical protein